MPKLTLRGWLVSAVALLVVLNVAWRIYAGWGLVTLKADKRPLREVIATIERQGHVTLKTNLDPATPVTLHLERMTVPDSLERLAAVTDARWRLTYAVARNQGAARGAFANWVAAAGNAPAPDGWKWFDHQLPFGGDLLGGDDNNAAEPGINTPDPRQDVWRVTSAPATNSDNAPPPNTLQAFLDLGSNILDVAFLAPADWNPAVAKGPTPGALSRVVPNLASAAGGQAEEAFLLMKNGRRGPRPGPADNNAQAAPPDGSPGDGNGPRRGGRGGDGGPGGDRGRGMAERMQARIDNLPPDQRAAAQARLNAEREFWQNLRNLSPEERRAAMEARMNDPAMQDRMMDRGAARDSLLTPQQRVDRYRRYVERREQIKNR